MILKKLKGRYGLRRFLRDGHRTAKEDPTRLYYDPGELKVFENIECEWPLFFCYLIIDAVFRGDREMANDFSSELDRILITTDEGLKLVPEMYTVPAPLVDQEYMNPHSQDRIPIGQCPFMWAQSLYIIGRLLLEGFIAPGELDPLNRRLSSNQKPDVVVQVVLLAEDHKIQETLRHMDFHIQTVSDLSPIEMQPARVLSHLFAYLGRNKKLQLSGRANRDVGLLSTSKLYSLHDRIFAFTPQVCLCCYWTHFSSLTHLSLSFCYPPGAGLFTHPLSPCLLSMISSSCLLIESSSWTSHVTTSPLTYTCCSTSSRMRSLS